MNKPRLVKREEIKQQQTAVKPAPAKPSLTQQLRKIVQERKCPNPAASTNARVAFAALFASV